jgi:hypothetical protein
LLKHIATRRRARLPALIKTDGGWKIEVACAKRGATRALSKATFEDVAQITGISLGRSTVGWTRPRLIAA